MSEDAIRYREFYDRFDVMFGDMDSRLKRRDHAEVTSHEHPLLKSRRYERVYCSNCGKESGSVVVKGTPIIYLCLPCSERYGNLPLPMIPGTENL